MNETQIASGLPEGKVVFTTTDGIGLMKFQQYWYIDDRNKVRRITITSGQDFPKGKRQYADEKKAHEFANSLIKK
jgi:hypothetical protein